MGMFQTTRWSLILATQDPGPAARVALEALCRSYRGPVLGYIRRHSRDPQEAEDLTQAFFLKFLEMRYQLGADPARGRFRSFLLTALKRFLANVHDAANARKRGGGVSPLALQDEPADRPELTPEREFERAWALTVLDRALQQLQQEAAAAGKQSLFAALREFLIEPPEPSRYASLAAQLQMKPNTLAQTVTRLRRRLSELIRRELADTVHAPAELDAELKLLRNALLGG